MTTKELTPARVRFAPSPTGSLHLGGLRTALFDWLYARRTGGQFILRVEDTDQSRYDPNSLNDLMIGLRWLGLDWDEGPDVGGPYGPYTQSERKELYGQYAQQLIDSGHAYRCYVTGEELAAMREEQKANKETIGYDRRHRNLTDEQRAAFEAEGRPSVVRFAAPLEGTVVVNDVIRGRIEVDSDSVRDPVILKSDGMPTYHLAVVIDDHHMKITHILRGEEWISSAPLHQLIHDALGWEMPEVVHLPVILDPSGKGKMSKRKKVVAGKEYLALVHEFIDAGYVPDAMFNFLTNVGWNYDAEEEVFTRQQAVERFDVLDINPSSAALPYPKLEWINGVYIREMAHADLHEAMVPYLSKQLGIDEEKLRQSEVLSELVPVIQERMKLLTDAAELVDWAFKAADEIVYDNMKLLIGRKLDAAQSADVLDTGSAMMAELPEFTVEGLEVAFRAKAEELELKPGSFFAPFRGAISGKKVSPPLFESMVALGKAEVLARVKNAAAALRAHVAASES
ncbi:MAG: glutamate--tRNA ligase [Chloroflexota bacterium]